MPVYPAPLVAPASKVWEGIDGPWSSIDLAVGSPPQDVRVLVSLAGQETWVVLPKGCVDNTTSCIDSRGNIFNPNVSSTWQNQGIYDLADHVSDLLGFVGRGQYGFDTVSPFWTASNVTLNHSIVAGFQTLSPWLGQLGVSPRPTNFSGFNDPQPSFLSLLKSNNFISSLSYGFQQGSYYRSASYKNAYTSLTFGGYDTSRYIRNNATFAFAADEGRELVVGLQSIVKSTGSTAGSTANTTLLQTGILAALDSAQPLLWLPQEACTNLEQAFGLILDNATNLYLVNSSHHQALLTENASLVFRIGDMTHGGVTADITFSYGSLALRAKPPLVANESWYFPLRVAANSTQYTLGRAFLQETYLTADYERSTFNLSQAVWNDTAAADVKIILPPSATPATPGAQSTSSTISTGAIVGIVIGCVAVLALLATAFVIIRRRRIRQNSKIDEKLEDSGEGVTEMSAEAKVRGFEIKKGELEGETTKYELADEKPLPAEVEGGIINELGGNQRTVAELRGDTGARELAANEVHELPGEDLRRAS